MTGRPTLRTLGRAAITAVGVVFVLAAGYVAALWNPEPFFAYR